MVLFFVAIIILSRIQFKSLKDRISIIDNVKKVIKQQLQYTITK